NPSFRSGLMGHQPATQHLVGNVFSLFRRLSQSDPATFTAPSCMNLRFNHNEASQLLGNIASLFLGVSHFASGNSNVVFCQNNLGLILVYFHKSSEKRKKSSL